LLPAIGAKNGKPFFGDAAVMRDYRYAGPLSGDFVNGYIWVRGNFDGRVISAEYNGNAVAVKLGKIKRKISIYENGGEIFAQISIKTDGQIYEDSFAVFSPYTEKTRLYDISKASRDKLTEISGIIENKIEDEIKKTAQLLQNEYKTDAYGFLETARKYNYELYKKVADNWDEVFKEIKIVPVVSADIKLL
jgi:hypothetical protein